MPETAPQIDAPDPARRFVLLNSFEAVRTALEHLVGFLSEHGADNDNLGMIELAVAEALNNIVEHAYVDTTGLIELTCEVDDSGIAQFQLKDDGHAMPDGRVPLGAFKEFPTDPVELPEGGFGWHLIHDLTDNLTYERKDGSNILRFSMNIDGNVLQ